jgi:hypothetical protein
MKRVLVPVILITVALACSSPTGDNSTPAPTVTLGANPSTIAPSGTSTLTWSSTDATTCTASNGWSGTRSTSGTLQVSPANTTIYTLTCTGSGGSASQSTTVTVSSGGPSVTLTANPSTIVTGHASTLSWTSSLATSCTASDGWTGPKALNGSQDVSPTATTTYTLTCDGPGGSASQSTTVTVTGSPPPTTYLYPLKLSPGNRYIVDQNDKPFLLVGDAAWSLISELHDAEADTYLSDRAQKGFTTVLVNLIEHMFADNAPANIYGQSPFTGADFTTPNPDYFAHADYIIQSAAQQGIVVLLAPLYLGAGCGSEGWCAEVNAAPTSAMTTWGSYVGNRYKNYDNIVWVIGGDVDPTSPSNVLPKVTAFVNALKAADTRHLITAHPGPNQTAAGAYLDPSWLSINNVYTYDTPQYQPDLAAYHASTKPYFLIETHYESEAAGPSDQALRAQSYWTVLSGGFGHVFGNCPIWNMGANNTFGYCSSTPDWTTALNSTGSVNMQHFAELFNARHWWTLVPDDGHSVLTGGVGSGSTYAAAAAASDRSSIIAYLPTSRAVTVNASGLSGNSMTAYWYNPATGDVTSIGSSAKGTLNGISPPALGDWVLVIDSDDFSFPTP